MGYIDYLIPRSPFSLSPEINAKVSNFQHEGAAPLEHFAPRPRASFGVLGGRAYAGEQGMHDVVRCFAPVTACGLAQAVVALGKVLNLLGIWRGASFA